MEEKDPIKLTQFSSGSGCGCKIAPADLHAILKGVSPSASFKSLLVGNNTSDDASVMEQPNGDCIISTTDFFMPIVDDARSFGRIAAANAISDVYAMGGKPMMALAILGWPIEQLNAELASEVLNGAQEVCSEAGIPLAGGHSIASKEPIFGLAVTGSVKKENLKKNNEAKANDLLFLTKPIGVGIVSTAMKRGKASESDIALITQQMGQLNKVGEALGEIAGVHAMTDVTGFGLLGHLLEVCEGSGLNADLYFDKVPTLGDEVLSTYLSQFIMPDNTMRNFKAFSSKAGKLDAKQLQLLCDPQTNGGLLIAVDPKEAASVKNILLSHHCFYESIGTMKTSVQQQQIIQVI
jgi:selenide,water dikinase